MVESYAPKVLTEQDKFQKRVLAGEKVRKIYDSQEVTDVFHSILKGKADEQTKENFRENSELLVKKDKFVFSIGLLNQERFEIGRYPLEKDGTFSKTNGIRLTFAPTREERNGETVSYYKMVGREFRGRDIPRWMDQLEVLDKAIDMAKAFEQPQS